MSQADSPELSKLCDDFTYLGRVLGKALIDNRILDITFSEPFYRWLLGTHEKMGLAAIRVSVIIGLFVSRGLNDVI